jgi:RNA polymerase sigma-70 factor (ECF subfamily)
MLVLVLPEPNDDAALLDKARRGDKVAIGQIYRRYVEPIYHFARLRLGDAEAAEDITSLVFEKFLGALAEGKGPRQHLRGWLFQVARNAIYDSYGKSQSLPIETIEDWEAPEAIAPESAVIANHDSESLRQAIRELSPDQQEILLLRFDQQLSVQETADILGKNTNTVKALQFRAVNRLRELLQRRSIRET